MNKTIKSVLIALLAGGGLVSSSYAGFNLWWSSQNSSYEFVQFNVPATCSVSIQLYAFSSGAQYPIGGTTGIWYQYTFLPIPTRQDGVEEAGVIQSPYLYGYYNGITDPTQFGSPKASAWVNVWGGGNGYSREEFRCSDPVNNPAYSSEYGQPTAGVYYVDCDSQINGPAQSAYAYAIVDISW